MAEKDNQTEIIDAIKFHGGYAKKFYDSFGAGQGTRFVQKKPFDIFGHYKTRAFAIECKQQTQKIYAGDYQVLDLGELKTHQVAGLDEFLESGGQSFVFINLRVSGWKSSKRIDRIYILPWTRFSEYPKLVKVSSVRLMIEGKQNGLYDMTKFLDHVRQGY